MIRHSYHIDLNMDTLVTAVRNLFAYVTGVTPRYRVQGGSDAENLALQNIQVYPPQICEALSLTLFLGSAANGLSLHVRATPSLDSWWIRQSPCTR